LNKSAIHDVIVTKQEILVIYLTYCLLWW